jgi:hypothetical protein
LRGQVTRRRYPEFAGYEIGLNLCRNELSILLIGPNRLAKPLSTDSIIDLVLRLLLSLGQAGRYARGSHGYPSSVLQYTENLTLF